WDAVTGQEVALFKGFQCIVDYLSFLSDGNTLLSVVPTMTFASCARRPGRRLRSRNNKSRKEHSNGFLLGKNKWLLFTPQTANRKVSFGKTFFCGRAFLS